MSHLLAADVAVALPGGVGTLAEASTIWAAAQTEPGAAALVVVGEAWQELMSFLGRTFVISADDLSLPSQANDVGEIVLAVERALAQPQRHHGARG
jgi:predicted Rossmann-fold nucleotide-binding protein